MGCKLHYSKPLHHREKTRSLMRTFFTSDTHFDDEYGLSYFNRPFKSMDEMNKVMASCDVGVDCTEFSPLSLETVASKIAALAKSA